MKPNHFKPSHVLDLENVDVSTLILYYLQQLEVEYVFGIPGGAIEPFYNALARCEPHGGPKSIVARHETGAVFMADGYARNSGKLGVCCATTGPGSTNLITGIASAYENQVPLLIITAQTALHNFGRRAFQDSADTGINIVGMMQYCTRYNSMVTHVDQLEQKLVSAIMTAMMPPYGPVHLSIPMDILRANLSANGPSYELPKLVAPPSFLDTDAVSALIGKLSKAKHPVFVLGAGAAESVAPILTLATQMNASIITTPDGKGLINPRHPLFKGVIGFAGHSSAREALREDHVDLVIVIGTIISEWSSDGWDKLSLLNDRLVHVDSVPANLTFTPMASLHVLGRPRTVFERILETTRADSNVATPEATLNAPESENTQTTDNPAQDYHFSVDSPQSFVDESSPIKPPSLMRILAQRFPPHTKFLADTGNSLAWAIHYLHPFDRRISERRHRETHTPGRRKDKAGLFQCAIEFASMGWAIGNAIGAALAQPGDPVVCLTGDGSVLMNGQEISVAAELQLPVVFIILNDGALGMVKHGQRMSGAEPIGFQLPPTNFAMLAQSMGVVGKRIETIKDLLALDFKAISSSREPIVLDVVIDTEQTPPLGSRINVLNNTL